MRRPRLNLSPGDSVKPVAGLIVFTVSQLASPGFNKTKAGLAVVQGNSVTWRNISIIQ